VTLQADIFSIGLILLEMAANIILPENGPIWHQLRSGNLDGIDFGTNSNMLCDFIKCMLGTAGSDRPSSEDLAKHPMIKEQQI
jgi:serine/threonine protein kinase